MEYNWPAGMATNVVMPAAAQQAVEWQLGVVVTQAVLWGMHNIISRGDPALLICMIASGLTCVMEPHLMYIYKFFYPELGQHIFLYGFGHPIPYFIPLSYSAFRGLATYLFMRSKLSRKSSLSSLTLGKKRKRKRGPHNWHQIHHRKTTQASFDARGPNNAETTKTGE